jgi:hypothetical protein
MIASCVLPVTSQSATFVRTVIETVFVTGVRMWDVGFDPSGFDGVWRMDLSESRVRDPTTGKWKQEWLAGQINAIRHEGATQHFRLRVAVAPDVAVYKGFTATFGSHVWVPYDVLHIDGDLDRKRLPASGLSGPGMGVNEPSAWLKIVYVDPNTLYRINRNPDGTPQYLLLRKLSKDRQTLTGTVLTPEGTTIISKVFHRDPDAKQEFDSGAAR